MEKKVKLFNKKQIAIVSLFIIGIMAITTAVTYALFTYATNGLTENKITVGGITFHYKELDGMGRGIGISDALPVASNENAKTEEPAFNFRITSTTGENVEVPYVVTARMSSNSDIDLRSVVDLHLTEVNGTNETATVLFSGDGVVKYNSLNSYNGNDNEKIIYTGSAYRNYDKSFKLRMWIDQNTNLAAGVCSNNTYTNQKACETAGETWEYKYNDKEFSVTVNVYASGNSLSSQEIESRQNTNLTSLSVNNNNLVPAIGESYDYSTTTNDRNIVLDIVTENSNATVEVVKTDSTYTNPISYNFDKKGIMPIASSNNYTLTAGDNYFRITVVPADGVSTSKIYKLKVTKIASIDATLSSLTISNCPLNETFNSETTNYTCTTEENDLIVTAIPTDGATTTITGNLGLVRGNNTLTIVVTPEDTTAQSLIYTVTVTANLPVVGSYANDLESVELQGLAKMIYEDNTLITSTPNLRAADTANHTNSIYRSTATNSGQPTYYFRGVVTNNYVDFAGQTWRVVRINEDGTVRLLMQDSIGNRSFQSQNVSSNNAIWKNYMYFTYKDTPTAVTAKTTLDNWYVNNLATDYGNYIANGAYFCEQAKVGDYNMTSSTYTGTEMTHFLSYNSNFRCTPDNNNHGIVETNIGLLTYDEVNYAGAYKDGLANYYYYLYFDGSPYLTMSTAGVHSNGGTNSKVWLVAPHTLLSDVNTFDAYKLHPVINLKADTTATKDTITGHYVVQ